MQTPAPFKTPAPFSFDGHGINDAEGQRIAKVSSCDPYTYETGQPKRNAEFDQLSTLFAAAPELLAAAKGILYGVDELCRSYAITHVARGQCKGQRRLNADDMSAASEASDQFNTARQAIEAAIRKAEEGKY